MDLGLIRSFKFFGKNEKRIKKGRMNRKKKKDERGMRYRKKIKKKK